jgi:hypothetical protein
MLAEHNVLCAGTRSPRGGYKEKLQRLKPTWFCTAYVVAESHDPQNVSSADTTPIGRLAFPGYFRYVASQSRNVLYQSSLFCGFRIQWPSSGKIMSFDGTPCCWSAVKNSRLCVYGTR